MKTRELRRWMSDDSYQKLRAIGNASLEAFLEKYIALFAPSSVYVCDDSDADHLYIRQRAKDTGEEFPVAIEGHTVHFDGPNDQGRDRENTRYLVSGTDDVDERYATIDREQGLEEITAYFSGSMRDRELYVLFFCLGPLNSPYALPCVQLTDSAYVGHTEDLLYRRGYDEFVRRGNTTDFFRFCHTMGALQNGVSSAIDARRIYIDLPNKAVYSANTQYAGNSVGLKKLAMRLAIDDCRGKDWLTEHMFIMGVRGPHERVTYFTGAFPSGCGKTSTAMLPGETIVGDDIAYIRVEKGYAHAANAESGIFGIIREVNAVDDPVIWDVLTSPGEVIFSNVLVDDNKKVYWLGMGEELPSHGMNFSGTWQRGKKDNNGKEIPAAHKNARYTVPLERLDNCDAALHDPRGVPVGGMIYGARDSDTSVPVVEAFSFQHGIITLGAALESETTSATLGTEGVRVFNVASLLDFLSYPIGEYIDDILAFGELLTHPPRVFGANYFLRDTDGAFMTDICDKHVWLKWMELRVHDDVGAYETPVGYIPRYDDLVPLFDAVLSRSYTQQEYAAQFTIRIDELQEKITRIRTIYAQEQYIPAAFEEEMTAQSARLAALKEHHGAYVSPWVFSDDNKDIVWNSVLPQQI